MAGTAHTPNVETATSGEATRYDAFTGSELDLSRWAYLEYPMPDGSSLRCAEPNARTEVADGTLSVHVERFENTHDSVQIIDNPKHLLLSTGRFALPERGTATFSVRMTARNIDATPHDYRDGFAAFNVLDMATGAVFDLCLTSDRIFAIHEQLPVPGAENPFTHLVENPLAGLAVEPGRPYTFEITLDRAGRTAQWRVDGSTVYEVRDVVIPAEVSVGLGLLTLHPIEDGRSRSVRGQGLFASWSHLSVTPGSPE